MKSIAVSGRITTKDLKLESRTINGKPVSLLKFAIANNDDCKNHDGKADPAHVDYYDVTLWGKQADALAPYLIQGKKLLVVGTPKVERYQNKAGESRRHFDIRATRIEFMDSNKAKATA